MNFPKLKSKLILAPLAGYGDVAFRVLCSRAGAGMVFTEMISADAVVNGSVEVEIVEEERPVALQLFGSNAENILKAAKEFENKVDLIDINMGCPSMKIRKSGAGSKLLEDVDKIDEILKILGKNLKIPFSIKVRNCENLLEILKIAEKRGASAIIVHARTFGQGYSGKADWKIIKKVKDNAKDIVVIGNGDVCSLEDAERMRKETGVDYVMIGREALRNPWIFRGEKKGAKEIFDKYVEIAEKYDVGLKYIKAHALLFTKGVKGGAKLREKINSVKELSELREIFSNL